MIIGFIIFDSSEMLAGKVFKIFINLVFCFYKACIRKRRQSAEHSVSPGVMNRSWDYLIY